MANIAMPTDDNLSRRKSVQEHIDELPMWADGTTLPSAPMTGMQWLIWSLAAAGKFFEGYVVFMTGVALPLFEREFDIAPFQHGVIGAASLFGILVGALALGGLSDRFGRKPMFVVEMIIFVGFLVALCFASSYIQVVIFLFRLGLALGCDYPTAHMIISENIPSSARGKLVLGAFAFQAVGALAGVAVGFFVLSVLPELSAWRWMYASAIIPAVLVALGRFYIVESANWLSTRGEIEKAEREAKRLLVRKPQYPPTSGSLRRRPRRRRRMIMAGAPSSTAKTAAPQSWRPFPGSCRTWEPTASASSPRPSSRRRSAARQTMPAASPT
jgi:putative MFS transporter